ncbi:hypothetical protein NHX12_028881 [Muraenolepis orangiensis]|uniref:Uncharacterized protein n=1 Tax=Muraenolepis orangiensis TaxID=630683 RepID=A0A9Q0EBE1_9TELE|nr:hypothetical protein NHX12_028881 [Muraenolepis orangiensis]
MNPSCPTSLGLFYTDVRPQTGGGSVGCVWAARSSLMNEGHIVDHNKTNVFQSAGGFPRHSPHTDEDPLLAGGCPVVTVTVITRWS